MKKILSLNSLHLAIASLVLCSECYARKFSSFLGKKYTIYAKIESGYISATFVCKDHSCQRKSALLDDSDQQWERPTSGHLRSSPISTRQFNGLKVKNDEKSSLEMLFRRIFYPLYVKASCRVGKMWRNDPNESDGGAAEKMH